MNSKSVICPHCTGILDTPESLAGQEVECPLCQKNFIVTFTESSPQNNDQREYLNPIQNASKKTEKDITATQATASSKKKNLLLPISLTVLILLLVLINLLLILSAHHQRRTFKIFEQRINMLQSSAYRNSFATVELTDQCQKIMGIIHKNQKILELIGKNQKTLKLIEENTRFFNIPPDAYEYKIQNFDRDTRSMFKISIETLAANGWEYVGVLTNNGINSKEILFRRERQRK